MEQRGKCWGGSLQPYAMGGGMPSFGLYPPAGLSFPICEMAGKGPLPAQGAEDPPEEEREPGATSFPSLLCSPASLRAGRGGARAAEAGPSPLARRELTRS